MQANIDPVVPVTYVFIKDYEFGDGHFHYNFAANYSLIIPELTAITNGVQIKTDARPYEYWYGIKIELGGLDFIDLRIVRNIRDALRAHLAFKEVRVVKIKEVFNSINEFIIGNVRSYLKHHEKH